MVLNLSHQSSINPFITIKLGATIGGKSKIKMKKRDNFLSTFWNIFSRVVYGIEMAVKWSYSPALLLINDWRQCNIETRQSE